MFTEKINRIFKVLKASSADIARFSKCDYSNISRISSGARIPKAGGKAAERLIDGIYFFADENGKIDELCDIIACENADSADMVKTKMMTWLYDGTDEIKKKTEPSKERTPFRSFGRKLDSVMNLAEISNVHFGKMINTDASYISRFRSGIRSPKSNPQIMDAICSALLERINSQDKTARLAVLIGVSAEALSDKDAAYALLYEWLYDIERDNHTTMVERLIENIDTFSINIKMPLPSLEETASNDILYSEKTTYFGTDGLREVVIRFLRNVINCGGRELWLYSDQSMDWLTGDRTFFSIWASLMFHCVKNGVKIRIIHNVDRDVSEISDAITSWLPLYMSGMIESFYSKKQKNARFSNTLFICPGYACVEGGNVIGTEEHGGIYRYHTDKNVLDAYKTAYNILLSNAKPLVKLYKNVESPEIINEGGVTVIGTTLSLATMPKSTLASMLERCETDENTQNAVLSLWENRRRIFIQALEKGAVYECVPTADDNKLFAGEVSADIPNLSLYYTPREYAEHIKNIIALSDKYLNYRFCALPDAPFEHTQIAVMEKSVDVMRIKEPRVTFNISHPALCKAFVSYVAEIKERYGMDKLTAKHLLAKYL
ncbi:MAG: hypothetical protein SOX77_03745 [Candidatus Borkfalkiaceae bacterium]|nr:hypothetical protein [Christensenellaceae bacterium]